MKKREERKDSFIPVTHCASEVPTNNSDESNVPEDLLNEFRSGSENTDSDNVASTSPNPTKTLGKVPNGILGIIPSKVPLGILGAGTPVTQWYQRPEMQNMLDAEMEAMKAVLGDIKWGKNCGKLDDGRMYWKVRQRIKMDGLYDTVYNILLVYEPNHPSAQYGTSVHAYLMAPNNLDYLQMRVTQSNRTPKVINHVLVDKDGVKYLCSASGGDYGTSLSGSKGAVSAKQSLLYAIKWLHNFECGLLSQAHWEKFQQHGAL